MVKYKSWRFATLTAIAQTLLAYLYCRDGYCRVAMFFAFLAGSNFQVFLEATPQTPEETREL